MNPIHEALFAIELLLLLGCAVMGVLWLVLVGLALVREPLGKTVFAILLACVVLLNLWASACTVKLREQVELAVASGGYGPPAQVREHLASELAAWLQSAKGPAQLAFVAGGLMTLLALVPWYFAYHRQGSSPKPSSKVHYRSATNKAEDAETPAEPTSPEQATWLSGSLDYVLLCAAGLALLVSHASSC